VQLDRCSTGLDSTAHCAERTHRGTVLRSNRIKFLLLSINIHSCAIDKKKFISVRFQPVGSILMRLQEAAAVKGRGVEVNTDRIDFVQ
jgi:hypothetical protein